MASLPSASTRWLLAYLAAGDGDAVTAVDANDENGRTGNRNGESYEYAAIGKQLKLIELPASECFSMLQRLHLSCNHITEITGLQNLPNLTHLDLSHNDISSISGLDNLDALTDLNLSGNKISKFEGLDDVATTLRILLLANNNFDALDEVVYLRRLIRLQSVVLEGNPFCGNADYMNVIYAFLGHVECIDWTPVDKQRARTAREQKSESIAKLEESEVRVNASAASRAVEREVHRKRKNAYLLEPLTAAQILFLDAAKALKLSTFVYPDAMAATDGRWRRYHIHVISTLNRQQNGDEMMEKVKSAAADAATRFDALNSSLLHLASERAAALQTYKDAKNSIASEDGKELKMKLASRDLPSKETIRQMEECRNKRVATLISSLEDQLHPYMSSTSEALGVFFHFLEDLERDYSAYVKSISFDSTSSGDVDVTTKTVEDMFAWRRKRLHSLVDSVQCQVATWLKEFVTAAHTANDELSRERLRLLEHVPFQA